ncbi:4-(cytidine 5'-diphospho)-2-C-methyl-D-erythritol kinase [Candidatus Riflebacteria bacterium]
MEKTIRSPAKINLFLQIGKKREDGYHEVLSLLEPIDLFDEIRVKVQNPASSKNRRLNITWSPPASIENDTVTTTAHYFFQEAGIKNYDCQFFIEKNIPYPAGLGAASSNAASVLKLLQQLYNNGLTENKVIEILSRVGCDCPFFFYQKRALFGGKGERLLKIVRQKPIFYYLLIPGLTKKMSTKEAYAKLSPERTEYTRESIIEFFSNLTDSKITSRTLFYNSFLKLYTGEPFPFFSKKLRDLGAEVVNICGSGPTIFGLFTDRSKRDLALQKLKKDIDNLDLLSGESLC